MKKFLAVSAALSLALSLAACGGSASSSAAASTPASTPASSAAASSGAAAEGNGDWAAIQEKGTLVVGMTIFDPMNYYDADGNLIGFDTELAQAVGEKLGVEVQFQEIEWNNKVMELDAGNIDCVWNGMTILDDLKDAMDFSIPYSGNMQVPVINVANADTYTSVESMNSPDVTVAAESGSAGEGAIDDNMPDANKLTVTAQRDCLTELKSGTIDVGVIDYVMADASVGEGTSYSDLQIVEGIEFAKAMIDQGADVFFGDASAVDSGAREAIDAANAAAGEIKIYDIGQPADILGQNECIICSQVTDNSAMVVASMEAVEAGTFGGETLYGTLQNGTLSAGALSDLVPADVQEKYLGYIEQMKADTFMK